MKRFQSCWNFIFHYVFSYFFLLGFALRILPKAAIWALGPHPSPLAFVRLYLMGADFLPFALSYLWAVLFPGVFFTWAVASDIRDKGKGLYTLSFMLVSLFLWDFSRSPQWLHLLGFTATAVIARYRRDTEEKKKKPLPPEQYKNAEFLAKIRSFLGYAALLCVGVFVITLYMNTQKNPVANIGPLLLGWAAVWMLACFGLSLYLDFFHNPKGGGAHCLIFGALCYPAYGWLSHPKDAYLYGGGAIILGFFLSHALFDILYGEFTVFPKIKRRSHRGRS